MQISKAQDDAHQGDSRAYSDEGLSSARSYAFQLFDDACVFLPDSEAPSEQSWSIKVEVQGQRGLRFYVEVSEWLVFDYMQALYPQIDIYNDLAAVTELIEVATDAVRVQLSEFLRDDVYISQTGFRLSTFDAEASALTPRSGVLKLVNQTTEYAVVLHLPTALVAHYDKWKGGSAGPVPTQVKTQRRPIKPRSDDLATTLNAFLSVVDAEEPDHPAPAIESPELESGPTQISGPAPQLEALLIAGAIQLNQDNIGNLSNGDLLELKYSRLATEEFLVWAEDRMLGYAKRDADGWLLTRTASLPEDQKFHRAVMEAFKQRKAPTLRTETTLLARTATFNMTPSAVDRLVKGASLPVEADDISAVELIAGAARFGVGEIVELADGLAVRIATQTERLETEEADDVS